MDNRHNRLRLFVGEVEGEHWPGEAQAQSGSVVVWVFALRSSLISAVKEGSC
jgi:hypothetical protein